MGALGMGALQAAWGKCRAEGTGPKELKEELAACAFLGRLPSLHALACASFESAAHAALLLGSMQAAVEEGIVAGGGAALLHASKTLDDIKVKLDNFDQKIGVQIIQNALR
jgi:hypothetical protein